MDCTPVQGYCMQSRVTDLAAGLAAAERHVAVLTRQAPALHYAR